MFNNFGGRNMVLIHEAVLLFGQLLDRVHLLHHLLSKCIEIYSCNQKIYNNAKYFGQKQNMRFTIQGINFQYKIIYFHKNTGL